MRRRCGDSSRDHSPVSCLDTSAPLKQSMRHTIQESAWSAQLRFQSRFRHKATGGRHPTIVAKWQHVLPKCNTTATARREFRNDLTPQRAITLRILPRDTASDRSCYTKQFGPERVPPQVAATTESSRIWIAAGDKLDEAFKRSGQTDTSTTPKYYRLKPTVVTPLGSHESLRKP